MTEKDEIVPQYDLLVQLAVATRRSWTEDDVRAAIAGAQATGRGWRGILAALQVCMNDPKAKPRDISPLAARRAARRTPADPDLAHRQAQLAREQWPNLRARRDPNQ
ncbi:hypothetical protein AB0K18_42990 [Nonomuraea sp. NPDC049421]|uniref:hypothetical protein n=1 Tax=Nonomuraea sp. NPDC049421 TaxID=3155275 RepID=UPI00341CE9DC